MIGFARTALPTLEFIALQFGHIRRMMEANQTKGSATDAENGVVERV